MAAPPSLTCTTERTIASVAGKLQAARPTARRESIMAEQQAQLLLRDVPPGLKLALMREAEHAMSNMSAVALAILAKEFKVSYEPRHARANAADEQNLTLNLRMPERLHKKLRIRAAEHGVAHSDVAIVVLAKHLGVEVDEAMYLNRRRGRKAA